MSIASLVPGSVSSGEIQIFDPDRASTIDQRHRKLGTFIEEHELDAILLTQPSSFSWFTAGGDATRGCLSDPTAALFITPEARVVLSRNTDAGRIFDREIGGLGFQLKERSWQESRRVLMSDVVRGRTVGCDQPYDHCLDISLLIDGLRLPLSEYELKSMRELGVLLSHAIEATARSFSRGETEAEVAAQLAHRLIRNEIQPHRLQVCADGQIERYRHWQYGDTPIEQTCTIAAVGRRRGLHVSASRTVSFGKPPKDAHTAHLDALLVQATGMFFSKPGWEMHETWKRVDRIYEKFGHSEEWHFADQGCVIGYEPCESPIGPRSDYRLRPNVPIAWQPVIGPSLVADTILIGTSGFELITPMESWPQVDVEIKGISIPRPDMLLRPE